MGAAGEAAIQRRLSMEPQRHRGTEEMKDEDDLLRGLVTLILCVSVPLW